MEKQVQQNGVETPQAPLQMQPEQKMQTSPQPQLQQMVWDLRSPRQNLIDRAFEAREKELQHLEQEKPGTRRKLAGITSLGAGVTGICLGIYFLTS